MNPFTQWIDGQPWWVTPLMLPVGVLASVAERVVRFGLFAAAMMLALALGFLLWRVRRRR